jgi:hypothetical protein
MYFCTALNISLLRSKRKDLFSRNHKSILMLALSFFLLIPVWNLIRPILSYYI